MVFFGNFSLMSLAQADHHAVLAVVVVVAGVLLAIGGFSSTVVGSGLAVSAIVAAVISGLGAFQFSNEVSKYEPYVSLTTGSYAAITAVVLLFVGAVLALRSPGQGVPAQSSEAPAKVSPSSWPALTVAGLVLLIAIVAYAIDSSGTPSPGQATQPPGQSTSSPPNTYPPTSSPAQIAAANEAAAVNQADQQLLTDFGSLQTDISNLQVDYSNLQGDLSNLRTDVQTTQSDAAYVNQDVNTQDGSACGDAESVQGDAQSTQGDFQSLQGDESSSSFDKSSLSSTVTQVQSDWSAYQATLSAAQDITVTSLVTSGQETTAVSAGQQEYRLFSSQESNATSVGKSLVDQAQQIANNSLAAANSGTPGGC
ncbi:MAG: hypothetical protein ACHQFZ_04265 [Acidimicrobiales bacterium]